MEMNSHVDPDLIPDDPSDPFWTRGDLPDWPAWVQGFRPWQVDACRELVDGWNRGVTVQILDAPTGTGKTLIGEMARRCMGGRASYICHSLRLQDQFLEDYPYASVVKGRSNYPTELGPAWVTAADCEGKACAYCENACPYRVAKGHALGSDLAVANTSYWLHEVNHVRDGLRGRAGLIVDECDVLEGAMMGFVEVVVSEKAQRNAGVAELKPKVHGATVGEWLGDVAAGLREWAVARKSTRDVRLRREVTAAMRLAGKCGVLAGVYADGGWVRQYRKGSKAVILKPVQVGGMAEEKVWRHVGEGGWVLAMSATVLSVDEWMESCGVEEAGVVRVDSPFPVENRPVLYVPAGDMKRATWERDMGGMVETVQEILDTHPNDAVLIHATSYAVAKATATGIEGKVREMGRALVTHDGAKTRDEALARYIGLAEKGQAPVIVSPSLDRGVDLPGDLCRVQIVMKVPFPNMGDRQVSERLHMPGGQTWYTANTARTIVQMTGRGVRSVDDHAVTYVLDRQFPRWMKQAKSMLPQWWVDGVKPGKVASQRKGTGRG